MKIELSRDKTSIILTGIVSIRIPVEELIHVLRECDPLPPRLKQVRDLVRQHRCDKEIASELGISVRTVKLHVSRLKEICGENDRYRL